MDGPGTTSDSRVELIRELERLEPLEERWRELAVERGNAFVTPEWFHCAHRHYGGEREPLVVAVRDHEGALVGLLPLTLERAGRSRTAGFAGSGLGDHLHPVAPAARDEVVAEAAGRALRSAPGPLPTLVLENVDAENGWWSALSAASGCGGRPLIDRRSVLPRLRFEGRSWEEYLASRSRNLRSQVGRKRRALERDHEISFRWVARADEVAGGIETLLRLHDLRWEARLGSSSLTSPRARAFLGDFARAAFERGWLRLCVLEADGEPVAAWCGWRLGERFSYYQAGFDPAWGDRSVGFVLFCETLRAAADEGAGEYDMLLGEESFKGRFADSARPVLTAVIAPRLRPARVLAATEARLRATARRLPRRVREPAKRHGRAVLERLPLARRR